MAKGDIIRTIREVIYDTIEGFDYYREVDGRNCYMHALKVDKHVDEIFPFSHKFEVGSISDNFEYIRTNEELERAFYKDMEQLGISCQKEHGKPLELKDKYEWKVALYQTSKPIMLKGGILCKCCHLIRQDYGNKKWTQKSGMKSCVTTVSRGIKKPKDLKLSFRYNGERVYYDYVGTYKLSAIMKKPTPKDIEEVREKMREKKVTFSNNINRNCYMYALNVDMDKDKLADKGFYFVIGGISDTRNMPVAIDNSDDDYYDFDNEAALIDSFYKDMEVLGVDAQEVDSTYELSTDEEWKVAIYYRKDNDGNYRDFHIIKQLYGDNRWYHKQGLCLKPNYVDDSGNEILTPEEAQIYVDNQKYEYVGTYKLSLKKDF